MSCSDHLNLAMVHVSGCSRCIWSKRSRYMSVTIRESVDEHIDFNISKVKAEGRP